MLDFTSEKGRIVSAALELAADKPWGDVTLVEISERAGLSLVELKTHVASKAEIVSALASMVDDEMLRRAPKRVPDQAARDALFEVIMGRFDVLEPYKSALKSMAKDPGADLARLGSLLTSQRWMLEAAGISADGLDGGMRVAGLAGIYASVFRTWLEDDDAGLARTMAALDRRLRRGEQTMQQLHDLKSGADRIFGAVCSAIRGRATGRTSASPQPPATASPPEAPASY